MKNLAIITARGGSKRIPRKNIREFMGKPMINYAIEACMESGIFDEIMVSTDDYEIAEIAKKGGAKIPFMRSEKTSNDKAVTYDVLEEVVLEYKKMGELFENLCCVYPCVPFLKGEDLKNAFNIFKEKDCETLVPVVRYSFPIQRAFKINNHGYVEFREPKHELTRSQDLEPMFHDVGMFYFEKIDEMLKHRKLICPKASFIELDEMKIQDIDTEDDWKMAEMKYKVLHNV